MLYFIIIYLYGNRGKIYIMYFRIMLNVIRLLKTAVLSDALCM